MKFFITGNLGYIGPVLTKFIKNIDKNIFIIGFDTGFFEECYTHEKIYKEKKYSVNMQIYGDIRDIEKYKEVIRDCDHVIHLSAISNDPMGKEFEEVTQAINLYSSVKLAKICCEFNLKSFVFASSCSVYGSGDSSPRNELDLVAPLTAYAKSKIGTELELSKLSCDNNSINTKFTSLRFATACGASQRLRLDLVLNDFVATAIATSKIQVLSDGSPWRPLIDVYDMSKALYWASIRTTGDNNEVINTGSNNWNYNVGDLAGNVAKILSNDVLVDINKNAQPDKRSYKVSFDKFTSLAPLEYLPEITLEKSVKLLIKQIKDIDQNVLLHHRDHMIRLEVLRYLKNNKYINENLRWN